MCSRLALGLGTLAVCCGFALGADDKVEPAKAPLPAGLVAPDAKVANAAVIAFLEGPAIDAENNVYFSDVMGNRIRTQSRKWSDHCGAVHVAGAAGLATGGGDRVESHERG